MKRVVIGIFAHPDDEAFGPSATLLHEQDQGADVHLVCVTCGEHGVNDGHYGDLAAIRSAEWRKAGALIGATSMHALNFTDGGLCNALYEQMVQNIQTTVERICETYEEPIALGLLTYDPNGLSGHLDHIAVSLVTTRVFYRLRQTPPHGVTIQELVYYCLSETQKPTQDEQYFVYSPPGRPAAYINRTVHVGAYVDRKFEIMRAHRSQQHDAEVIIGFGEAFHATDHFHVIT